MLIIKLHIIQRLRECRDRLNRALDLMPEPKNRISLKRSLEELSIETSQKTNGNNEQASKQSSPSSPSKRTRNNAY